MLKQQINNEEVILNYIRRYGPASKAMIAKQTGITPPTVSNICNALLDRALIFEDGEEKASLGRPSVLLRFNKEIELALIIHIRTHNLCFYVVNFANEILCEEQTSIIGLTSEEIISLIHSGTGKMIDSFEGRIKSIGMVFRGPVDSTKGISIYSPNAKWTNVPFKYILEERFGIPVYMDNDVRALATGEFYYGKGRGAENLFVVKFSYGLGASFLYKGNLYRGFNEGAGEIGDMLITGANKEMVTLESVASETAIRKYIMEAVTKGRASSLKDNEILYNEAFRVEPVYEAALEGDELALEALKEIGSYLGTALANITNLVNPERIVLCSSMGDAVSLLDPIVREVIENHSHRAQPVELVYSGKGSFHTLLGMIEIVCTHRVKEGRWT